jgi:hypothetical protein
MDIKERTVYETSDKQRFDLKLDAELHVNNQRMIAFFVDRCDFVEPTAARIVAAMNSHTDIISDWLSDITSSYARNEAETVTQPMSSGNSVVRNDVTDHDIANLNFALQLSGSIYRIGRANVIYIGLFDTAGTLCNGEDNDDWLSNDKEELDAYVLNLVNEAISHG